MAGFDGRFEIRVCHVGWLNEKRSQCACRNDLLLILKTEVKRELLPGPAIGVQGGSKAGDDALPGHSQFTREVLAEHLVQAGLLIRVGVVPPTEPWHR